ncbi:MAG: hypothetical protein ACM3X5_08905 [Bacillota bacterium]
MSKKDKRPNSSGELSEQQLDKIAGGQEVRKMETIVVTAKRPSAGPQVVKMEQIVVTGKREDATTQIASADPQRGKKN